MAKKYWYFTGEEREFQVPVWGDYKMCKLYQIQATDRFEIEADEDGCLDQFTIKDGELGGWISKDTKLAQDGSWVKNLNYVYDKSTIYKSYIAGDGVYISNSSIRNCDIYSSKIIDCSMMTSTVRNINLEHSVMSYTRMYDSTIINARVSDYIGTFGDNFIENARVVKSNYIKIDCPNVGSFVFYKNRHNRAIMVSLGVDSCMNLRDFTNIYREQFKEDNRVLLMYDKMLKYVRLFFADDWVNKNAVIKQ